MFTLGIFTTHIPYITLVVFYAFFWVFGVNKASAGEIQLGESRISIEIGSIEILSDSDQNHISNTHNLFDQLFLTSDYNVAFAALQKLKHRCFHPEIQLQCRLYTGLFNRPPPFLS